MMVLLALLLVASCSLAAAAGNQSLPVEVFMKGENISGFNPAGDKRAYYCFRIPQLLALPSGKLLAFAEGRADGCRPDGHVNRPIVVRGSSDSGKTWGPIGIAGPALPHLGTNYPGAYVRDKSRYATASPTPPSSRPRAATRALPGQPRSWPASPKATLRAAPRGRRWWVAISSCRAVAATLR